MSDTPRTDTAEFTADWQIDCSFRMKRGQVVSAEFAQELERELAKTERLRFGADATRRQQRCELDALRAENERLKAEVTNWISHCACDNPCNDPEPWTTAGRAISALQKENAELARKALTPSTSPATPASAIHPCSKSHPPLTSEP